MIIKAPTTGGILKASFVDRPNRFVVRCVLEDSGGRKEKAHMPNPGRLQELLLPGRKLYLAKAPTLKKDGTKRSTRYTVVGVERGGRPVYLDTHGTNAVARRLLEEKMIPPFRKAEVVRAEVPVGRSRFDFLLSEGGRDLYLEVKSVTLFANGLAMFPDAPTERGRRHLEELAAIARGGGRAAVLFLVHSASVTHFLPDYHTDLEFARTLLDVRRDIRIIPAAVGWSDDLEIDSAPKILTIPWDRLEREAVDRGSYLLILKLNRDRKIEVGALGALRFPKGFHIYVGSAMNSLSSRINRHRRKEKKLRWHIDYLRREADGFTALPIRSSVRQECELARAAAEVLQPGPARFGSSDCGCPTHLFYSPGDPLHSEAFHEVLETFRMG